MHGCHIILASFDLFGRDLGLKQIFGVGCHNDVWRPKYGGRPSTEANELPYFFYVGGALWRASVVWSLSQLFELWSQRPRRFDDRLSWIIVMTENTNHLQEISPLIITQKLNLATNRNPKPTPQIL